MKCPRCGSEMVEKPPTTTYLTNPPQWDRVVWCGVDAAINSTWAVCMERQTNKRCGNNGSKPMTKLELQQRLQAQIDLNIKLREQNSILTGRLEALHYENSQAPTTPAPTARRDGAYNKGTHYT